MSFFSLHCFFRAYGKVLALIVAMLCGVLFPQLHVLSFLVRYLLMTMLFLSFLDLQIHPNAFRQGVWRVLAANLMVAFLAYVLLSRFDHTLALTGFLTGIAPTATAAPVLVGFVEGQVLFMVAAVLLTNLAVALVIPLALPLLLGNQAQISTWQVLQPVLLVMFFPLILARLVNLFPAPVQSVFRSAKRLNFAVWIFNLLIISANSSNFVRSQQTNSFLTLIQIALVSLLLCIFNFTLGGVISRSGLRHESSQALGQKNITFVVWIALTFINPMTAMGPTFYILYHNLYNAWQIYRFEQKA